MARTVSGTPSQSGLPEACAPPDDRKSLKTAHVSACSSTEAEIEAARRELNAQIRLAAHRVSTLKSHLNALAPISRLSFDIVSLIFSILVDEEPVAWWDQWPQGSHLGWIQVTHVYRHWRNIALQNTSLWTTIPFFKNLEWTKMYLLRSKRAPLHVDLFWDLGLDLYQAFSLILPELPRIRHLGIHVSRSTRTEAFFNFVYDTFQKYPAPVLETLCLNVDRQLPDPKDAPWPGLPVDIFKGCAPRLQSVCLKWLALPCDLSALGALTDLWIHAPTGVKPSLERLAELLKGTPQLQKLTLFQTLIPLASGALQSRPSLPSIELPSLSELILAGGALECAEFMMALKVSTPTALVFFVMLECEELSTLQDTSAVLSAFTQYMVGSDSMELMIDAWYSLLAEASPESDDPDSLSHRATLRLNFTKETPFMYEHRAQILAQICRIFRMHDVASLTLALPRLPGIEDSAIVMQNTDKVSWIDDDVQETP